MNEATPCLRDCRPDNALGVISDALLLSHCEFLVGTHTSVRAKL